MNLGDAHIYADHMEMLEEQLQREPFDLPTLKISDRIPAYAETGVYEPEWLTKAVPADFELVNYKHHPAITAPMSA